MLLTLVHLPPASAQTSVINWSGRGWYTAAGENFPANDNYYVGDARGQGCGPCTEDSRNFFVFDLSSVTQPIGAATLVLTMAGDPRSPGAGQLGYNSADPSEDYELHDVTTSLTALLDGTGGVVAYADLGSGVVYGSRTITSADNGYHVEIQLTASAIAAMNSSHGSFAIGGSITTLDDLPNNEGVFAWSYGDADISQLRLTLVPEPSTLTLSFVGPLSLGFVTQRRHKNADRRRV